MAYATIDDIQSLRSDLLDQVAPRLSDGAIDYAAADRAILAAEAVLESYTGQVVVSAAVRDAVIDLSLEQMATGTRLIDEVTLRADRVRAWLRDIAAGKATLSGQSPPIVLDRSLPMFQSKPRRWGV